MAIVFYKATYFTKSIFLAEASGYTNKQELTQINNDLNLINYEVMNTLTDSMPFIDNCMMTTFVRHGKLIVKS